MLLNGHIIHLPSAEDRLSHMAALNNELKWNLSIFDASDGSAFKENRNIAKMHPWTENTVSQGILGCTHSHLALLEKSIVTGNDFTVIFEDDCQLTSSREEIEAFIREVRDITKDDWDIILLGANEYVDGVHPINARINRVKRFWGTHAMIIKPMAARGVLRVFREAQAEGIFLPADWLYNESIRRRNLNCFAPNLVNQYCRQVPGLISAITGKKR